MIYPKSPRKGKPESGISLSLAYFRNDFSVYFRDLIHCLVLSQVLSLHSGGTSGTFPPWSDKRQQRSWKRSLCPPSGFVAEIRALLLSSSKHPSKAEVPASLGCCQREAKPDIVQRQQDRFHSVLLQLGRELSPTPLKQRTGGLILWGMLKEHNKGCDGGWVMGQGHPYFVVFF